MVAPGFEPRFRGLELSLPGRYIIFLFCDQPNTNSNFANEKSSLQIHILQMKNHHYKKKKN